MKEVNGMRDLYQQLACSWDKEGVLTSSIVPFVLVSVVNSQREKVYLVGISARGAIMGMTD